jgi:saccharopine dehydrogenase-like NADP-dependent oxidoreductase
MKDVAVVGAGRIGSAIAEALAGSGDFRVTVFDRSEAQFAALKSDRRIETASLDISEPGVLSRALRGKFAVLNAAPYRLTVRIAEEAAAANVHYLDLTEDVASTRRVRELAKEASTAFIPQCGLAPGFITIVTNSLAQRFDTLDDLRMRVGALPQYPSNALNYNLTWSPDGVINEYCEPCEAIVDGTLRQVLPLTEVEEFSLDGVRYEAFNTSGGLGSICETFAGKVRNLNYRSVRYPGHAAIMRILLKDLRLSERRDLLKDILEQAIPTTLQDVVVVFVTITGWKDGQFIQETYANRVHSGFAWGKERTAIQMTTAAGICAVLDLLVEGALPQKGLVRQEDVLLDRFLANRFGRIYATAEATRLAA